MGAAPIPDERAEVQLQDIAVDHPDVGAIGVARLQLGEEVVVELDQRQLKGALDQVRRKGAPPRSDLDHRVVRPRRHGVGDPALEIRVDEEVLAQRALGRSRCSRGRFVHGLLVLQRLLEVVRDPEEGVQPRECKEAVEILAEGG